MSILSRKAYIVLLLGDISILYVSVWFALSVRSFSLPSLENAIVHLVSFSLLFGVWFIVYFISGLYGRYTVLFRKQLPHIIFTAQAVNIGIAALFFFLIPIFLITPKTVLVLYLFISTVLLYFWRVHMYPHLLVRREIGAVLIGTGLELTELAEEVNKDPLYPLEFRAIIHPELSSSEEVKQTIQLLIESGEVTTIVADMSNHSLDDLLSFIYDITFVKHQAEFIDVRRLYQEIFERVPLSLIDYRWLLQYMSLDQKLVYSASKRSADIVASVIFGILSLALYPFIILAIKLEGTGSIFYVAQRVGLGGELFSFPKFRSMTGVDTDEEVLETKHTVTRVGALLRRTRLDELPQLWSVFKGDMSFIGPRPEFPALVDVYKKEIPYYNLRNLVKPGLSGWAQITHDNHAHHKADVDSTVEKLSYDLFYIKERSLWLDFYIAALTLKTILTKRGS
ncbi:MAG: hypothetical protein CMI56_01720 [Parcubacteria group bacterium]|nr:hypothetical protein [Parcubacteria group bacterium]